jgi:putative phosphoribosyl transferase
VERRAREEEGKLVQVSAGPVTLEGNLALPPGAQGLVLFAHGSGSSRFSPRNRYVANVLQQGNLGTLLIDLLTEEEERIDLRTREIRFDIPLLADRLVGAVDWLRENQETHDLRIGLFGSSTGAAAALMAAPRRPEAVGAVVSRGGRPDLAGSSLRQVEAPTLLIVGGRDAVVITLNEQAMEQLRVESRLEVVPGAGHLFEEPGALERVAALARDWFQQHLTE